MVTKLRTLLSLGVRNIARVASYRMRLRAGIHPVQRIGPTAPAQRPFFSPLAGATAHGSCTMVSMVGRTFGWRPPDHAGIPDWHRNPFTGRRAARPEAPWWTIPDFDPEVGDVKTIWEASRFDWVAQFAQQAALGDERALTRLNDWLQDWWVRNPPYLGHNWKCGQEASLRVMHLAVAALVLGQTDDPHAGLVQSIATHLERIAPTVAYAVGQDNNHGTSEAAALLIGGSWLAQQGDARGRAWERTGRELLADRARRLIETDGSFSQYSVNYHRLMLDTLSLCEVWRRRLALEPFPNVLYERASAATAWLHSIVDRESGDAPNIGANDGANLLPLTNAGYRDFRPSVSLAAALFQHAVAYPEVGSWHDQLAWLGVEEAGTTLPHSTSCLFDDGGYAVLRRNGAMALLRYPRFRFRPGHADALHIDLWYGGENLLRDGGTYSYNAAREVQEYFTGAPSHNGVQFDDHDQMPRLGRFLWGDWVRTESVEPMHEVGDAMRTGASYRDGHGATHRRLVALSSDSLRVTDTVGGFARRAVIRWRLRPGDWRLDGERITDGTHSLVLSADVPFVRRELVAGWESRFYMQREPVPVLEVEVATAGTIESEYRWTQ